ncbi:hypothetical protein L2E82_43036 [Cichorium intybus]|uniref:Uncharacterized protein n=1 Tax=Cichorium intybus TaxID=13427 RepID=A0ACB8ZNZ4_CICIN|nr:hypothetical protein L2E82_43036 [Cichorium intybus]
MSSLTFKMMAGSLPPVTGSNGSNAKGPATASVKRATLPLQVRVKEVQKLETPEKTSTNVSRRNLALFLAAGSITAVNLSSPNPAEARMSRSEIKKVILEKLRKLREKIGLSKPETEENEKIAAATPPIAKKETPASPVPSEKETPASPVPSEKETPTPAPPEPSLPNLQNDKKTVVEASILP